MNHPNTGMPKAALRILRRIVPRDDARYLIGDFVEIYRELRSERGPVWACLWIWSQVMIGIPRFIQHHTYWSIQMFKNYLISTLRNMGKNRLHSFINVAGLAIGLACVILILLFVRFELSYDSFNRNKDRIYRVVLDSIHDDGPFPMAPTMLPLAPALRRDFPEVERAARISERNSMLVRAGENRYYESLYFADPEIFSIFDLPLEQGNPASALSEPFSIVLTDVMAEKYFGRSDPVGRILRINDLYDFTVTGVLEEIPQTFHLRIKMLASFDSLRNEEKDRWDSWDTFSNDYTYILLASGADPAEFEGKLPAFQQKIAGAETAEKQRLWLQSLQEIHFSSLNYDDAVTYEKGALYAFSAIVFFIMLLACVNFMNLATARSAGRAREVGMRKVVGARRAQLIIQFLTESFLLAFVAVMGAVGLVYLVLPRFGMFLNRQIAFDLLHDPGLVAMLCGIAVFTGFVAGSYPALMLSAFSPVRTLRCKLVRGGRRFSFRTVFIVLQFTVSIVLIIATLSVYQQLHFMKSKNLGFFSDQVVTIPLQNSPLRQDPDAFKNAISNHAAVLGVTCASGTPGSGSSNASNYVLDTPDGKKEIYIQTIYTDFDFVDTFGLKILEGRNFSKEFSFDRGKTYILNETAARQFGWDSPVGKQIARGGQNPGQVIGVVEDFHYSSMRTKIRPMALNIRLTQFRYLAARVRPQDASQALNFLENTWNKFAPEYPFEHFFADEKFDRYYRYEQKVGELFGLFSILAIVISCLGIFGMISFTAEQSTKEIGVRKVLGASAASIVLLLSKRFVRWVLTANLVAWPLAWFAMNRWLEGFAYRISINPLFFPLAGLTALTIALATVSYHSLKTALADPAESLRYE
jgi:putative ABC transport system permease protein